MVETIFSNLFLSLTGLVDNSLWKAFAYKLFAFSPLVLLFFIVTGFIIILRIPQRAAFFYFIHKRGVRAILFFLFCILGGLVYLFYSTMHLYIMIPYALSIPAFFFFIGCKAASIFKENEWALVYLISVVIIFIAAYFISGAPTISFTGTGSNKRELRKSFQKFTGRNPDQDEKKNFWKGALGEEKPSESKKDEYWRNNK